METSQESQQQYVQAVYDYAANLMVEQQRTPEQVKKELIAQGIDMASASTVVSNVSQQIKKARQDRANKDMAFGALWCIGGIAATVANIGFIFWGAIVFGGIQFISGAINANK